MRIWSECTSAVWVNKSVVLEKARGEKDATGPKCSCFVAVCALNESQGLVLQTRPIQYQFNPGLMSTERVTILTCDSIDISLSGTGLVWVVPWMRM